MPQLSSILLVDDDLTTNFLNKTLLTRLGVTQQLLFAENGVEGVLVTTGRKIALRVSPSH
ncbi:hypothetical protein [Hymenobacter rubidus]|uniref:hypothetical protein n=1 Tax=Hymenobacter rubidus TaxID=1441626 RepID=UPI00191D9C57|nr:hypothetical protein [Hymenobacter rubidus]